MARTVGSDGERTMEAIREAGIRLIHKRGYGAVTLRQIAADVGLQAGSLYNYIQNKEHFLYQIMSRVMQDLHDQLDETLADCKSPAARLKIFVEFHIKFHTARKREVYIGNYELRSLSEKNMRSITDMRKSYERKLIGILIEGEERGAWKLPDVQVSAFAIISMLTGVCAWYKEGGRLSKDELVENYTSIILYGLQAQKT